MDINWRQRGRLRISLQFPRERSVFMVDLETKQVVRVEWGADDAGPTDFVALP